MAEISLKDYAEMHGLHPATVRQRASRGAFSTARKVGRDWIIDSDEPLVDHRYAKAAEQELKYSYFVVAEYGKGNTVNIDNVFASSAQSAADDIRKQYPHFKILNIYKAVDNWK